MKRFLFALLLPALLLALSIPVTVAEEEVENDWYFPLAQGIYKEGQKFSSGDGIVILPGQVEKVQNGRKYEFYIQTGDKYEHVGWGTVVGVNFWESNARLELKPDVPFITTRCFVKVPVQRDRCFNQWMEFGKKWEAEKIFFDAFCAFYRATVYVPGDQSVRTAYLRTGYFHYLAEAMVDFKAKKYESASEKLLFAAMFKYPGGDFTELDEAQALCDLYAVRKDEHSIVMEDAAKALAGNDVIGGLGYYNRSWVKYISLFDIPGDKTAFLKDATKVWREQYQKAAPSFREMINTGRAEIAFDRISEFLRFSAFVADATVVEEASNLMKEAMAKMKPGTPGHTLKAGLDHLAASQTQVGYFSPGAREAVNHSSDIITGLALAAFARTGSTNKVGPYRDNVAKAVKWVLSTAEVNGSLSSNTKATSHIFLLYGLAEVYAVTGDPSIYRVLRKAALNLESRQLKEGIFGEGAPGVDVVLDTAIATMAIDVLDKAGILFKDRDEMLARINSFASARLVAGTETINVPGGRSPAPGSPEDFLHLGALLTMSRVSLNQFPTGDHIKHLLRSRDMKPSTAGLAPDGWMMMTWMWSSFGIDNWKVFCVEMRNGIASMTTVGEEKGSYTFPLPRTPLFRYLSQTGLAAFNTLALAYTMNRVE